MLHTPGISQVTIVSYDRTGEVRLELAFTPKSRVFLVSKAIFLPCVAIKLGS